MKVWISYEEKSETFLLKPRDDTAVGLTRVEVIIRLEEDESKSSLQALNFWVLERPYIEPVDPEPVEPEPVDPEPVDPEPVKPIEPEQP